MLGRTGKEFMEEAEDKIENEKELMEKLGRNWVKSVM